MANATLHRSSPCRWHSMAAIALMSAALTACGGGGSATASSSDGSGSGSGNSSGSTNDSALSGTYAFVTLSNNGAAGGGEPASGVGDFGTMTFDGAGNYTGTETVNSGGTIAADQSISGTYSAASSGSVTLSPLSGNVSADGNTLVLANMTSGEPPSMTVAIKEGGTTFSAASLQGSFTMASLNNSGSSGLGSGGLLTLTFDGAGNFTGSESENDGGTVTSNLAASGTYSVTTSGSVTLTSSGGSALTGQISADGDTMVLGDLTSGDAPSLYVAIKQGTATFSNASLDNAYSGATLQSAGADGGNSGLLSLTFDGAGSFSGTDGQNNGETVTTGTAVSGSYSVASGGSLTISPNSVALTGEISTDGDTVALEDLNSGDPPSMTVVIR